MRSIFVDTDYWIASIIPRDRLHHKAITVSRKLAGCTLVTSEMVLAEMLNMFARGGPYLREVAVDAVSFLKRGNFSKRLWLSIVNMPTRVGV
jgi:predicted nucleic acid-binding protein